MVETSIIEFCKAIKAESSTKAKRALITTYKDDYAVTEFLKFLYDKLIVTGISGKRLTKVFNHDVAIPCGIDTLLDVINYLKTHNTGTDMDIGVCQSYLDRVSVADEDKALLAQIITKSLKLGIDTTLVNSAIPGLIYVHEVQQALALKNVTLKDGEWFCLSQKLNGNRATFKNGKLISRQGKDFVNLEHILTDLKKLEAMYPEAMVFDGEIIRKNIDGVSDNQNFTLGTGILNSKVEDKTALSFIIFDMLPLAEFNTGEGIITYRHRYHQMQKAADIIANELHLEHVEVVPFLYAGTDQFMIQKCLDQMDAEGKEGCMLARDVTYKCKRHNGLLKVKTFYTMDLPIVGFETGTGKNANTLGNIVVQYKDNRVGVGSGFSDAQREWFWEHKDELLGRIVEVKYKDISKDKTTGKESLQFPVFVQLREPGKAVSFN